MGFLDNLKLRGVFDPNQINASSGIDYGLAGNTTNPLQNSLSTIMPFMNKINQMGIQNQRIGQTIRNEDRMRQTFNPRAGMDSQGAAPVMAPQNVVFNPGPKPINEFTRAMSGQSALQNQNADLAKRSLAAKVAEDAIDNRRADQKLGLDKDQLTLDRLKNSQIYDTKIKDMERKTSEAESKLELATRNAAGRETNAAATQTLNNARLEAQNARHQLDIAQKEAALTETKRMGDARIRELESAADARKNSTTTTVVNADGTEKVATTVRGGTQPNAANPTTPNKIKVIGPNGETGSVPANSKLPAGWKKVG